jgi:hypothetical protein
VLPRSPVGQMCAHDRMVSLCYRTPNNSAMPSPRLRPLYGRDQGLPRRVAGIIGAGWSPSGMRGASSVRSASGGPCTSPACRLFACSHPLRMSAVRTPQGRALWCGLPTGEVPPYLWEKSPVAMGEVPCSYGRSPPYLWEKSPVPTGEVVPYNLLFFEGLCSRDFQTVFQRRHIQTHHRVCAAQHERGWEGNRRCSNPGQLDTGYPVSPK